MAEGLAGQPARSPDPNPIGNLRLVLLTRAEEATPSPRGRRIDVMMAARGVLVMRVVDSLVTSVRGRIRKLCGSGGDWLNC
jgi:hypothetical protein